MQEIWCSERSRRPRRHIRIVSSNLVAAALFASGLSIVQAVAGSDPIPQPAVQQVLQEFRMRPLVAIGEASSSLRTVSCIWVQQNR